MPSLIIFPGDDDIIVTTYSQMISGGLASFAARCVTQPLDVLKIRLQLQLESARGPMSGKHRSLYKFIPMIYKEEGMRGFWRGHNASQIIAVPVGMSQFWLFAHVTRVLNLTQLKDSYLRQYVGAFLTGTIHTLVFSPFDLFKTILISKQASNKNINMIRTMKSIIRLEGIPGLYKGSLICSLSLAGKLALYCLLEQAAINEFHFEVLPDQLLVLLSAFSAGAVHTAVYPLEVIKRRRQIFQAYRLRQKAGPEACEHILQCGRAIFQREGPLGLFKGLQPALLKTFLTAEISYIVFEEASEYLENFE